MVSLSIVIVSYNTKSVLDECLKSIYKHTQDLDFEVIVVDNLSTDGSQEMLKSRHPHVKLIESQQNLGFGKANNLGAKKAKGDWLLFLNPDTVIFNNALKMSLDSAQELPKTGAYSCRLLFEDKTIQPSGGYFPNLLRLFAWQIALDEVPLLNKLIKPIHPPSYFYNRSFSPDWITGAFMLIPRYVFELVNGFDEKIFMYGEELELCFRIRKKGYQVYYQSHPSIIHLQAKSSSSQFALVSEVTGIKYFFKKHKPSWQKTWVNLAFRIGSLLRYLFFGIIQGNDTKKATYAEILRG